MDQREYEVNQNYVITNAQQFWDEPYTSYKHYDKDGKVDQQDLTTAAIYALVKENYDIVAWLEQQGATAHKGKSAKDARTLLENAGKK